MIWALVKIGKPAVGPLMVALHDHASSVQAAAAQALGEIGDPVAMGSLLILQKATNADVRNAAEIALAKLGVPAHL